MKVQMACDNVGVPIYCTYPHMGTMADITIYKEFPPLLDDSECGLADKGYVGADHLIVPHKKKPGQDLSDQQVEENKVSYHNLSFIGYRSNVYADFVIFSNNNRTLERADEAIQHIISGIRICHAYVSICGIVFIISL